MVYFINHRHLVRWLSEAFKIIPFLKAYYYCFHGSSGGRDFLNFRFQFILIPFILFP